MRASLLPTTTLYTNAESHALIRTSIGHNREIEVLK